MDLGRKRTLAKADEYATACLDRAKDRVQAFENMGFGGLPWQTLLNRGLTPAWLALGEAEEQVRGCQLRAARIAQLRCEISRVLAQQLGSNLEWCQEGLEGLSMSWVAVRASLNRWLAVDVAHEFALQLDNLIPDVPEGVQVRELSKDECVKLMHKADNLLRVLRRMEDVETHAPRRESGTHGYGWGQWPQISRWVELRYELYSWCILLERDDSRRVLQFKELFCELKPFVPSVDAELIRLQATATIHWRQHARCEQHATLAQLRKRGSAF